MNTLKKSNKKQDIWVKMGNNRKLIPIKELKKYNKLGWQPEKQLEKLFIQKEE